MPHPPTHQPITTLISTTTTTHRYQAQKESMKMETQAGRNVVERVAQGLKATRDGELMWLLDEEGQDPFEHEKSEGLFSNINDLKVRNVKDTVITNYYLPKEKALEFLIEAFEELAKARLLLRWSYPFALFEFDELFQQRDVTDYRLSYSGGHPSHRKDEYRVGFDALQSALEAETEELSDMISRKRLRGSKSAIMAATRAVRNKRSDLECLVVQYSTPFEGDIHDEHNEHEMLAGAHLLDGPQEGVKGGVLHGAELLEREREAEDGARAGTGSNAGHSQDQEHDAQHAHHGPGHISSGSSLTSSSKSDAHQSTVREFGMDAVLDTLAVNSRSQHHIMPHHQHHHHQQQFRQNTGPIKSHSGTIQSSGAGVGSDGDKPLQRQFSDYFALPKDSTSGKILPGCGDGFGGLASNSRSLDYKEDQSDEEEEVMPYDSTLDPVRRRY